MTDQSFSPYQPVPYQPRPLGNLNVQLSNPSADFVSSFIHRDTRQQHTDFLDEFEVFDDVGPLDPFSSHFAEVSVMPEGYVKPSLNSNPIFKGGVIGTSSLAITLTLGGLLSESYSASLATAAIDPHIPQALSSADQILNLVGERVASQANLAPVAAATVEFSAQNGASSPVNLRDDAVLARRIHDFEALLDRIDALPIPIATALPSAIGQPYAPASIHSAPSVAVAPSSLAQPSEHNPASTSTQSAVEQELPTSDVSTRAPQTSPAINNWSIDESVDLTTAAISPPEVWVEQSEFSGISSQGVSPGLTPAAPAEHSAPADLDPHSMFDSSSSLGLEPFSQNSPADS